VSHLYLIVIQIIRVCVVAPTYKKRKPTKTTLTIGLLVIVKGFGVFPDTEGF
jgi:hypothetical protein